MKTLLLIVAILAPLWVFSQNNGPNKTPSTQAIPAAPKPERYTIVLDNSAEGLSAAVSKAMNDGWEPAGGIAVSTKDNSPTVHFYQAMVKRLGQRINVPATQR